MTTKLKTFLNHERYQIIGTIAAAILICWGLSCESKVQSLKDPTQRINRDDLDAEVTAYLATAEARYKSLDRQDDFKRLVFDQFVLWTQATGFNANAIIPLAFAFLGIGASVDNARRRRKDKSSTKEKTPTTPTE